MPLKITKNMSIDDKYNTLKYHLDYDADSGIFVWKTFGPYMSVRKKGDMAGNFDQHNRRYFDIDQHRFTAGKVAWYFHYGEIPFRVYHINGDKSDNRITNLSTRAVTQSSTKIKGGSVSRINGVTWMEHLQKWRVRLSINGKQQHLGITPDLFEAACMVISARNEMNKNATVASPPLPVPPPVPRPPQ